MVKFVFERSVSTCLLYDMFKEKKTSVDKTGQISNQISVLFGKTHAPTLDLRSRSVICLSLKELIVFKVDGSF